MQALFAADPVKFRVNPLIAIQQIVKTKPVVLPVPV
jgi:hypothetical protein